MLTKVVGKVLEIKNAQSFGLIVQNDYQNEEIYFTNLRYSYDEIIRCI